MKQKKLLIVVACLAPIFLFEEENRKFSLKEINVSNLEKTTENAETTFSSQVEGSLKRGDIILENNLEDFLQEEIAYPIDESNFEEVFGGAR